MGSPNTAKAATAATVNGLRNEQLGSGLDFFNTKRIASLQVAVLTRRRAISAAMVATVTPLVFGEAHV
jgi:hypothetical protein